MVQRVVEEEKVLFSLKEEVTKALGPSIITEDREVEAICDDAMERLDVMSSMNKRPGKFEPSLAVRMLEHKSPKVRRLGARLSPVSQLHKVMNDKSSQVRSEVAKRVELHELKEMLKRFPGDENIRYIYEAREDEAEFDMYGEDRLGDVVKQQDEQELTELWYESLARDLVHKYKHQTEGSWKHTAVARYVSSVKATSGVDIDGEKLLEAIDDIIEERDEELLSAPMLRDLRENFDRQAIKESTYFTMGEGEADIVSDLVNSRLGPVEYLSHAVEVFSVKEGRVPRAVARIAITEGVSSTMTVPVSGQLPHEGFRSIDEQALDLFVECWNKRRSMEGNPLRISWAMDSESDDGIVFDTTMR
jgi:hypothetical protein